MNLFAPAQTTTDASTTKPHTGLFCSFQEVEKTRKTFRSWWLAVAENS